MIDLTYLKAYLGISVTTYDTQLTYIMNAAIDAIERFCNRPLQLTRKIEVWQPETGESLPTKFYTEYEPKFINYVLTSVEQAIEIAGPAGSTVAVSSKAIHAREYGVETETYELTGAEISTLVTAVSSWGDADWAATANNATVDWSKVPDTFLLPMETTDASATTKIYGFIPVSATYEFDRDDWSIELTSTPSQIMIDYLTGYDIVPDDLKQKTAELCKRMWDSLNVSFVMESETIGNYSYTNALQNPDASLQKFMHEKFGPYIQYKKLYTEGYQC